MPNTPDIELDDEPCPDGGLPRALYYARRIVSGYLTPYEGARRIWLEIANEYMDKPAIWDELRIFVHLATEWDDRPAERAQLEQEIRDEARKLVTRHA
jgi:hypothetical protein